MAKQRRVGVLLPTTNQTFEPDFYRVAPPGVTIHTGRMWLGPRSDGESGGVFEMNDDIERAAPYVASAKVELMVYACTGGSFVGGPGFDKQVMARIEKAADVPAIVTSSAVVEALREMGLRRLSVATPYTVESNQRLKVFLEGNGFEVLNVDGEPGLLNSPDPADIGDQDPEVILDFVPGVVHPEADGVFCSCTAWRSLEVVGELERRLGKPVVTSNQATIWLALKRMGITTPIKGYGRLLESLASAVA